MTKITYANKVNNSSSGLAANKKVADVDMNEIKTVVNANDDTLINAINDIDELANISGAVPFSWDFDINNASADPTAGKFRLNNLPLSSALYMYLSITDNTGINTKDVLDLMTVGAHIYIQNRYESKQGALYEIASITDNTTWFSFVLTVVSASTTSPSDGDLFAFRLVPSPSGGSGDVSTDNIWDNKGDLAVATGSNAATKVAVGADGQSLRADSGETNGVKWGGDMLQFAMALSDENVTDLVASATPVWSKYIAVRIAFTDFYFDVITAPVGSAITIDVHRNGTTIFSTKPTIASGANTSSGAVISTSSFAQGDLMEIFVDAVGSTTAGKGLKGDMVGIFN